MVDNAIGGAAAKLMMSSDAVNCKMCLRQPIVPTKHHGGVDDRSIIGFGFAVESLIFRIQEKEKQQKMCIACRVHSTSGVSDELSLSSSTNNWLPILYTLFFSPVIWVSIIRSNSSLDFTLGTLITVLVIVFSIHVTFYYLPVGWYYTDVSYNSNYVIRLVFEIFDIRMTKSIAPAEFAHIFKLFGFLKENLDYFDDKEISAMFRALDVADYERITLKEFMEGVEKYIKIKNNSKAGGETHNIFGIQNDYFAVHLRYDRVLIAFLMFINVLMITIVFVHWGNGENIAHLCASLTGDELSSPSQSHDCLLYVHSLACSLVIFFALNGMNFAVMRNLDKRVKFKLCCEFITETMNEAGILQAEWVKRNLQDVGQFENCDHISNYGFGISAMKAIICCCSVAWCCDCRSICDLMKEDDEDEKGDKIYYEGKKGLELLTLPGDNEEHKSPRFGIELNTDAISSDLVFWVQRVQLVLVWMFSITISSTSLFTYTELWLAATPGIVFVLIMISAVSAVCFVMLCSMLNKVDLIYNQAYAISALCAQPINVYQTLFNDLDFLNLEDNQDKSHKSDKVQATSFTIWWQFRSLLFDTILKNMYEQLSPLLAVMLVAMFGFTGIGMYYFIAEYDTNTEDLFSAIVSGSNSFVFFSITVFVVIAGGLILRQAFRPYAVQSEYVNMLHGEIIQLQTLKCKYRKELAQLHYAFHSDDVSKFIKKQRQRQERRQKERRRLMHQTPKSVDEPTTTSTRTTNQNENEIELKAMDDEVEMVPAEVKMADDDDYNGFNELRSSNILLRIQEIDCNIALGRQLLEAIEKDWRSPRVLGIDLTETKITAIKTYFAGFFLLLAGSFYRQWVGF